MSPAIAPVDLSSATAGRTPPRLEFIDGRPTPASWERAAKASLVRAEVGRALADERRRDTRRVRLVALAFVVLFGLTYWLALAADGPLGSFAGA